MKRLLRLALLLLVVVPVAAWFVVKPVRVVAPSWVGATCRGPVCVDSEARRAEATRLYDEARRFVDARVGKIEGTPRVVFCATPECAERFGLGDRSAVTLGTLGTVIGPRAWQPHYVRHELIHDLQGERLGVLRRILMPGWLIEGMAYSLSEDPRPTLAEPWQSDRARFEAWLGQVGREAMWQAARAL